MSRRGATALEFALVIPTLVVMLGGVSTLSWVLLSQAALVDAVGEGARRASVVLRDPSDPTGYDVRIQSVADTEVRAAAERAGWDPNSVTVAVGFVERDGIRHMTVQGIAPLASRWEGLLFPVPVSLQYQTTLATLDQEP